MYKLLIADDEYEIRNGLGNYFPWNDFGFEVVGQVENGQQALDFLRQNPVDLLLCDIMMPLCNGIEVAKTLFETQSPVKIVFISGYKEFEYARQALIYGVSDYIVKPTKYNELVDVCTKLKQELDRRNSPQSDKQLADDNQEPLAKGCNYPEQVIAAVKTYIAENYQKAML